MNNQLNIPLRTVFVVIDFSFIAIYHAEMRSTSLRDRLAYWQSINDMFEQVIPMWNCHIHILFVQTLLLDRPDDFGSELLRDI